MEAPHHYPDQQALEVLLAELAGARNATRGSLLDARNFDADQLTIETDFRALLFGLGRGDRNSLKRMQKPVLSDGRLQLAARLPANTHKVIADTGWWIKFLNPAAIEYGRVELLDDGGCVLEHQEIKIDPRPRQLSAEDVEGRLIAIGYPKIDVGVK